jgi:uncharacterized repeat protein (TIGR01451 family)
MANPTLDLTTANTSGAIGDAVLTNGQFAGAPTSFFTFVELQQNGAEQGYNSDGPHQFDEKNNGDHSVLLASVPIIIGDGSNGTADGVAYREFQLSLSEPAQTKQFVSLDSLQIWQEESGSLTNFTPGSGFAGAHTNYLAYNLDAGGNNWVAMADDTGKLTVLVPDSDFINDAAHRYVTLYSGLGFQGAGFSSDGGSDNWGLTNASGGSVSALTVHKTATVPGGTANAAGEVISYAIRVDNVGNTTLTGLTVTDRR